MPRQTVSSVTPPNTRWSPGPVAIALRGLAWLIQRDCAWRETRRMARLTETERHDMALPQHTDQAPLPRHNMQGW